ncbi:hypothetical protein OSB04_002279 [Centaurea solstitialis]|uniref:Pollen Ole e 1 allergen and extensin family protein n=1 Tax=Centaurea solstitialis TaxID=347529 RepID=A0AA38U068_9ASTR|nr:hypothetical protein OSB04_002279 [Centaurea solstitialis]
MRMMMMMMIFFLLLGAMGEKPLVEVLYTRDELTNLAGYGEQKLSTVVVAGTLLCDSFSGSSLIHSHPIPGASVVVACRANKKTSKIGGKTDEYGDFLIDLPSHLHAIPNMEKRCIVRVVEVPKKSGCHHHHHRALIKHKAAAGIKLLSSGNGIRTYTTHANGIHFTHKQQHSHPFTKINTRNRNTRSSGRKMLHML